MATRLGRRAWGVGIALVALLGVSVLLSCSIVVAKADLEGFDEPGQEAETSAKTVQDVVEEPSSEEFLQETPKKKSGITIDKIKANLPKMRKQDNYHFELAAAVFMTVYAYCLFTGRSRNKRAAMAWVDAYLPLFEKNFALVGRDASGKEVLMTESPNFFKLYASGRRFCQGLLATLNMKPRHDLLMTIWGFIYPFEDSVELEVFMNEASMPPIVFAVGTNKVAKQMLKEKRDLELYAKKISISKDQAPYWPGDKLQVVAEHSSIFYDLFAESKVQQIFSSSNTHLLKYFRSLYFTSENPDGTYKRVLRFTFSLPPANKMDELFGLIAMVPLFIDLVGAYKLPPDLKKRALEARTREADKSQEDTRKKRQEALLAKKAEKQMEEKARLARMDPIERQKYEDKKAAKDYKKQLHRRTKLM